MVVVQILAAFQKSRALLVEQGFILTTVTLQTKFVACYATNVTWLWVTLMTILKD